MEVQEVRGNSHPAECQPAKGPVTMHQRVTSKRLIRQGPMAQKQLQMVGLGVQLLLAQRTCPARAACSYCVFAALQLRARDVGIGGAEQYSVLRAVLCIPSLEISVHEAARIALPVPPDNPHKVATPYAAYRPPVLGLCSLLLLSRLPSAAARFILPSASKLPLNLMIYLEGVIIRE
ncbi:hypothetical protein BDZ91DRAFT_824237 [Kalaharituber pfeilii]|nr:hypothetical protein BDZ91DRAFT_824237 [Kalaharituber pfeilii]